MMKRSLLLLLPFLLIASDLGSVAAPVLALPTPTLTQTLPFSSVSPTLTQTPSPTDTYTLTFTPLTAWRAGQQITPSLPTP
jgi:hypothetical protein